MASGTPATALLRRAGVAFTLHPYAHDPRSTHFGDEAVAALGRSPAEVFKTLVVSAGNGLACAVVPVSAQLDLKAFASAVGAKRAALADPAVAARTTGYVVGGISPLGQKTALRTVIDSSAGGLTTIFVSAGRRGLQVQLAPADLVRLTGATLADIATR